MINSRKATERIGQRHLPRETGIPPKRLQSPSKIFPIDLAYFEFLKRYGLATMRFPFTNKEVGS